MRRRAAAVAVPGRRLLPLRLYMLGVAVIAIIPGLISATVDVAGDITSARAEEERRLHAVADRVAVNLDREIVFLINVLAGVAAGPEAEGGADGMQARVSVVARLLGLPMALHEADRIGEFASRVPPGQDPPDLHVPIDAAAGGVTDVVARPGQDTGGADVFLPVVRDGAILRVLAVALTEARVEVLIGGLVMRPEVAVDVLDSRGRRIAHLAAAGRSGLLLGTPVQPARLHQMGGLKVAAADGSYQIAAIAHPSRAPGWLVVASAPSDFADGDWIGPLLRQAAVFGAAVLIAAAVAWRLGGRLTRPLAQLGERARAVASGSNATVAVAPSGVLEFETLRASLQRAEMALQRRAGAAQSALQSARTSSEQLASVMNATADLIFVSGLDGRYILANRAAAAYGDGKGERRLLGLRASDVLGPDPGLTIEAADREVLRTGVRATREITWSRPGSEPRVYAISKAPWRDAAGETIGIVSVTRDVTDQRAAEARLRAAQAELLRATHLSAMGAMASGLAHELNQPLAAATNFLAAAGRLLLRSGCGNDIAAGAVRDASLQVQRAAQIVRRLRDFVSRGKAELDSVELGALLSATADLARAGGILGDASLFVSPPAEPLHVLADRVQMQQVLLNLIRNGAEAIVSQAWPSWAPGRIVLAAGREGAGMGRAQITITDNGPGMPPEIQARLFTPFVSTKPDGMGIGLAICHSIVEGHGGRLSVETGARGTTFRISLPPANGPEERDEHPDA